MEGTSPKTFVFVLMPFSDEFSDIYDVEIEPACRDASAYCERVDKQIFTENILQRVYNQIAKADLVVAEMTGRNPNVFYEVGYAHALNKSVILLTQKADDIPFDLKHYPHIVYGGKIGTLKVELEKRVRWFIDNPKGSSIDNANLQFLIRDPFPMKDAPVTEKPIIQFSPINDIYVAIDIYNPTGRVINPDSISLSLISPDQLEITEPSVRSEVKLPNGHYIYNLIGDYKLFPGGWDSVVIKFSVKAFQGKLIANGGEIILRVFTQLGPNDYPFEIIPFQ